ncbi:Sporulation related domain-containing protein [Polynucleobacter meluiroseus]|jgi:cell division protein FtsN|uniref:Sporulation related domain-containing protein n=1 Tax=Polynucleobacter meluiroseus TaxID=1938814 RepID=A0A240DZW8_9BURK|nr:SPOR domain-containing protein [Polynucleobacter meluiroseus]SNX27776.1 Sporulation related domain-containing protein [Polynucleobacter meluiroseus]
MNQKKGFIRRTKASSPEYGGTIIGFIVGLAVGLGVAFLIAFYLSKHTPQERPGMRAPSFPLTLKSAPTSEEGAPASPTAPLDLNKPLQGKQAATPVATADPIGELLNGKKAPETVATPAAKVEAVYFLQVGAFAKRVDADGQKANLAIQGIQSQLSEISNDGNTVWRVRVGPFDSAEESNPMRDKLNAMGIKPTVIKANKS